MSWTVANSSCVSVDRFTLKPCWKSTRIPYSTRCFIMWLCIMCSKILCCTMLFGLCCTSFSPLLLKQFLLRCSTSTLNIVVSIINSVTSVNLKKAGIASLNMVQKKQHTLLSALRGRLSPLLSLACRITLRLLPSAAIQHSSPRWLVMSVCKWSMKPIGHLHYGVILESFSFSFHIQIL